MTDKEYERLLLDQASCIRDLVYALAAEREAVRVLGEALACCNRMRRKWSTMTYRMQQSIASEFGKLWANVNNNPIAAKALDDGRPDIPKATT